MSNPYDMYRSEYMNWKNKWANERFEEEQRRAIERQKYAELRRKEDEARILNCIREIVQEEVRAAMATQVRGVKLKDGKVVRVHKMSVSKKIGNKAKADRKERAWKAKSK